MERPDLVKKLKDTLAEALHELSRLGLQIRKPAYLKGYVEVPTELRASESLGYCSARAVYYPFESILIVEVEESGSKARWGGFVSSYSSLLEDSSLLQEIGTPYGVAVLVKVIRKLSGRLKEALETAWEGFTLDYKMVESVIHEEEK